LEEGPGFLWVRLPRRRRGRQGRGRADQGAFFAWRSALAFDARGWRVRECGGEEETPHHIDGAGEGTYEGLRGRAAIGRHTDGAGGERCGHVVDDATGEGAARVIGPLQRGGQRFFARECTADGQTQMVTGPTPSRETHDGPHQGDAPQGAIFLAGGAGTIAVMISALDVPAGLFHGGIIEADVDDGAVRHQ